MISMRELQASHPFFTQLCTHVYHATSPRNYQNIIDDGYLRPNAGGFPDTTPQSTDSRARKLNAISFFDFASAPRDEIFTGIVHHWWTSMIQSLGWPTGILLGFSSADIKDKWISQPKAKELVPEFSFMLPDVEACYRGDIPISLLRSQVVYTGRSPDLFACFNGQPLASSNLLRLEKEWEALLHE